MNRFPFRLLPVLSLGLFLLAPAPGSAQSVERGESGDITAKAAVVTVTVGAEEGNSGAVATKAVGVLQGESGEISAAPREASDDEAPSWAGKSVTMGLSDNQPVMMKAAPVDEDDSSAVSAAKGSATQGDDRAPAGAKSAPAGEGDDSGSRGSA